MGEKSYPILLNGLKQYGITEQYQSLPDLAADLSQGKVVVKLGTVPPNVSYANFYRRTVKDNLGFTPDGDHILAYSLESICIFTALAEGLSAGLLKKTFSDDIFSNHQVERGLFYKVSEDSMAAIYADLQS